MNLIDSALTFLGRQSSARPWPPPRLSLALQGGGSFGAFTAGVLDRLLDEPQVEFDAISGASAGAVNAVLLASGLVSGREEAKARLRQFWRRMSRSAAFLPKASLAAAAMDAAPFLHLLSPYQFNPFNLDPLRDALAAEVDFVELRARAPLKLLIGATRVRDGRLKIFGASDLTIEAVLASSCLPLIHHAVEIDGEPYWDGGYAANPPLLPLVVKSEAKRMLIVQVTPNSTPQIPTTPSEVARRIEQIQFNSTLNRELDALRYGQELGISHKLGELSIDLIAAQDEIEDLAAESAANLGWPFLSKLHASGRDAAGEWLKAQAGKG